MQTYTESNLVEFGNYLFQAHNVRKVMGDENNNVFDVPRKISDADISNFKEKCNYSRALPSAFQLGEIVYLDFGESGRIDGASIIKVHFTNNNVLYDVEIVICNSESFTEETIIKNNKTTRLYNIDSNVVNCIKQTISPSGPISTMHNFIDTGKRRDGNTTRQIDNAIQLLFQGKTVKVEDHSILRLENSTNKFAINKRLCQNIMKRLQEFKPNLFWKDVVSEVPDGFLMSIPDK